MSAEAHAASSVVRYAAQALLYAAFMAVIGYFSTSPPYEHLPPNQAVLKLSITHAGARKEACRERSAEELAKLAPNMRAQTVCPRERAPIVVDVMLDEAPLYHVVAPPTGFAKDGAATIYRRIPIPAGSHRIAAKLADDAAGTFAYTAQRTVDLPAGRVVVIDFDPARGGFVLR
jgi:hypothetical protein